MSIQDKILIVDDDQNIVALLQELFTSEGFTVFTADDGEKGFKIFEECKPSIIILDGLIPKLNGFELAAKIRQTRHGYRIPIILASAIYRSLKVNDQLHELDINDFIEKPYDLDVLVTKVKQLLQISIQSDTDIDFFKPQGTLTDTNIVRLLYLIYRDRQQGSLVLLRDKLKKKIIFRKGEPLVVESNIVQECLGRLLTKKGKLTPEQCEESLKLMKINKIRQGQALINMGLLKPNELDEALREQAKDRIIELFTWSSGDYQFTPSTEALDSTVRLAMSLPQLLLIGTRHGIAIERLKIQMADYLARVATLEDNPSLKIDEFRLASWDERILTEIDGSKTLNDLLQLKNAREVDTYQLLYVLWNCDLLSFSESDVELKIRTTQSRLSNYLEEIRKQDFYTILGIGRKATEKELFVALSKKLTVYQPNKTTMNPTKNHRIHQLLTEICEVLDNAHLTLTDPKKKRLYDRQLFLEKGVAPLTPENAFNSEEEIKRVRSYIDIGEFNKAASHANAMQGLFPAEWPFLTYEAWANFKLLTENSKCTEQDLQLWIDQLIRAVQFDGKASVNFAYLGSIYKYLDDMDKARIFFQKAVDRNPDDTDSAREVRLIDMRESKKSKSFIKWK